MTWAAVNGNVVLLLWVIGGCWLMLHVTRDEARRNRSRADRRRDDGDPGACPAGHCAVCDAVQRARGGQA